MRASTPNDDRSRADQFRNIIANRGLASDPDPVATLHRLALEDYRRLTADVPLVRIDRLVQRLAAQLDARCELIRSTEDITRIRLQYSAWFHLEPLAEFEPASDTQGVAIARWRGGYDCPCSYLVLVDARGPRATRAAFTCVHELAHILILPPNFAAGAIYHRSGVKDEFESLIDRIAADIYFDDRLFGPALRHEMQGYEELTFGIVRTVLKQLQSDASELSACRAALLYAPRPTVLLDVEGAGRQSYLRGQYVARHAEAPVVFPSGASVPPASVVRVAIERGRETAGVDVLSEWRPVLPGVGLLRVRAKPVAGGAYAFVSLAE